MPSLRSFDLNLLTVFEAVYEAGSITEAGHRLGLTQSAVSHAVGRLRTALRDDLFVRSAGGLKPTAVAGALYPAVRTALDGIRGSLDGKRVFDPMAARTTFRIAVPHVIGPFLALELADRLAAEAPHVRLEFDTQTQAVELLAQLEDGRTDAAVDWWLPTEARFVTQRLFDDRLLVMAARGHPRLAATPSLAQLARERMVALRPRPGRWERAEAVRHLLALRPWTIALTVSEFLELPMVVGFTELVSVMPASMQGRLERSGLVRFFDVPEIGRPVPVNLVWHAGRRRDPAHAWLRRVLQREVRRFALAPTAAAA